jgi:gliding motility-associated lipoprotein GldH
MKAQKINSYFLFFILTIGLLACQTIQLFEQSTIYPDHKWPSSQINSYHFNITDTNSLYKVFFVIRHHNAYHYKNIWIDLEQKHVGDSAQKYSLNLNLADDVKGWQGVGMDDIYDQRIPVFAAPVKLKQGENIFSMHHTMREDPLDNILATGIRVEKAKP